MTSYIREHGAEMIRLGYPICEITAGTKACKRPGWQEASLKLEDLPHHLPNEGVGVLCGMPDSRICAIDADIEGSREFARDFYYAAIESVPSLEFCPCRIGKAPKFLFVARASEAGWTKRVSPWWVKDGARDRLEILGKGQQFVAYAIHPDTKKPYSYPDKANEFTTGGLISVAVSALPEVTSEDIDKLIAVFSELAKKHGYTEEHPESKRNSPAVQSEDLASVLTPSKPPIGMTKDEAVRKVRKAKYDVESYESWVNLGMMLKHEFQGREDEGLQAYIELSLDAPNASTPEEIEAKWNSFKRNDGDCLTMRTICHMLEPYGDIEARSHEATAYGLAMAFVSSVSDRIKWLTDAQQWLIFNGIHWEREGDGVAAYSAGEQNARTCVSDVFGKFASGLCRERALAFDKLHAAEKKPPKNEWRALQARLDTDPSYRRRIVQEFVAGSTYMMAHADEFDVLKDRFPVANGSIDLTTGQFVPPRAEDMIHAHSPVPYIPGADCPTWKRVVSDWMCGDKDLERYFQKLVGYALQGDPVESIMVFFVGEGSNGKSLCLGTLSKLFGRMSRSAAKTTLVSAGRSYETAGAARSDLAALRGARLVVCSESEDGDRLRSSDVKAMTGGEDKISARSLYENTIEFKPTWLLIMATNHMPTVFERSAAIDRRIRIIPFNATYDVDTVGKKNSADKGLKDVLTAELSGILNWAIEGALMYRAEKLAPPEAMLELQSQYRDRVDFLGNWFNDNCRSVKDGERVDASLRTTKAFWNSWKAFARENDCYDMFKSQRVFIEQAKRRMHLDLYRSNSAFVCRNYCLRSDAELACDGVFEEQAA